MGLHSNSDFKVWLIVAIPILLILFFFMSMGYSNCQEDCHNRYTAGTTAEAVCLDTCYEKWMDD